MGVLGWSEDQALDALMSSIRAALKGRNRLISNVLLSIFGAPAQPGAKSTTTTPPNAVPATPRNVHNFFKLIGGKKGARKNGRKSRS
jgi:hypothetical protein